MDNTVEVLIPVDSELAEGLNSTANRMAAGELVNQMLRSKREHVAALKQVIAEIKADARAAGLTDEDIDAELEAYNAERRTTG